MREEGYQGFAKKMFPLWVLLGVCLLVLVGRLFLLQVVNSAEYATLSDKNQIRIIAIPARRGNIYDKNMKELATSKPVFSITITSSEIKDKENLAANLAEILAPWGVTKETIFSTIKENGGSYEPIVIKRLQYEEGLKAVTTIEENRDKLPGVMIMEEPMRYYPYGRLAGHIIGTVGRITADEKNLVSDYGYSINDWVGKTGLEKAMERYTVDNQEIGLRGKKGVKTVEVNASHKLLDTRSQQDPVSGNSLVLTIDANLQATMESAMENTIKTLQKSIPKARAGSGVLIDVKTGAILAMVSYPYVDPNDFANGLPTDKTAYYMNNKDLPLFDRAIAGAYPPGSTFKMVTLTAALMTGKIDVNTRINCTPAAWVDPKAECPTAHGNVNLLQALAVSCNNFFQEIGLMATAAKIYDAGWEYGLGHVTGIELPGEAAGLLPNADWKAKHFTGREATWRPYDTYYMSMGQGYNMITPLQLANYVATIANGGYNMRPYLVDKILDPAGNTLFQQKAVVNNRLEATADQIKLVQKAMRAVAEPGGTASGLFGKFPVAVAAKTGTAQTGLAGDDKNKDYHGIFVAFAPYDNPQVAFAGVIEYGYHGGSSAGLVCKAVFEKYFGLNEEPIPTELPDSME